MESSFNIGDTVMIKGKVVGQGSNYIMVQVPQVISGQETIEICAFKNQCLNFHEIKEPLLMVRDNVVSDMVMKKFCVAILADEYKDRKVMDREYLYDMSEVLNFNTTAEAPK